MHVSCRLSCTVDTAIVNSFILFCDLERRLQRNQAAFRAALVDQLLAAGGVVIPPPSAAATPSHANALRPRTAQRRAGVGGEGAGGSGQPVIVAYGQHQMSKVEKKSRGDCAVCSASCYYKCVTCVGTQSRGRFLCVPECWNAVHRLTSDSAPAPPPQAAPTTTPVAADRRARRGSGGDDLLWGLDSGEQV